MQPRLADPGSAAVLECPVFAEFQSLAVVRARIDGRVIRNLHKVERLALVTREIRLTLVLGQRWLDVVVQRAHPLIDVLVGQRES